MRPSAPAAAALTTARCPSRRARWTSTQAVSGFVSSMAPSSKPTPPAQRGRSASRPRSRARPTRRSPSPAANATRLPTMSRAITPTPRTTWAAALEAGDRADALLDLVGPPEGQQVIGVDGRRGHTDQDLARSGLGHRHPRRARANAPLPRAPFTTSARMRAGISWSRVAIEAPSRRRGVRRQGPAARSLGSRPALRRGLEDEGSRVAGGAGVDRVPVELPVHVHVAVRRRDDVGAPCRTGRRDPPRRALRRRRPSRRWT